MSLLPLKRPQRTTDEFALRLIGARSAVGGGALKPQAEHLLTMREILGRGAVHPFPARMAPGLALAALGEGSKKLTVLDPMVGSGTVVAVARKCGHRAIGFDVDPLAVLTSRVWTRTVDVHKVQCAAEEVLSRAKAMRRLASEDAAYPSGCDSETRDFIAYWFDVRARTELAALAGAIQQLSDRVLREAIWCGFSRTIVAKRSGVSLARDLVHSRPHRQYAQSEVSPFDCFLPAVAKVVENCPQLGRKGHGPIANISLGDARSLRLADASVDIVLTSPPYLNAIDYMRCSKFALVWMGHSVRQLRQVRSRSVGTEASNRAQLATPWVQESMSMFGFAGSLAPRHHNLLAQYVFDMGRALAEVARVLRPNCTAMYVVGDSTVRGTFIPNSEIITYLAERHGMALKAKFERELPANRRYLPPPRSGGTGALDGRMRREVVLSFVR